MDGPASHVLDLGLDEELLLYREQISPVPLELFNAPNHVNLCASTSNCPDTTIGLSSTGKIFNAGDARIMQVGMKFIF